MTTDFGDISLGKLRFLRWGLPVRRQIFCPSKMPDAFASVCQRMKGTCVTPDSLALFKVLVYASPVTVKKISLKSSHSQISPVGSVLHCSAFSARRW